jgi:predicted aminopeptidase
MGKVQAHRRRVNALRRKLAEVEAVKAVAEEELTAVGVNGRKVLVRINQTCVVFC